MGARLRHGNDQGKASSDLHVVSDHFLLQCGSGKTETLHARRCIITVPLRVLQMGSIEFVPPLSDKKTRAIASLRMEAATKLVFTFNNQFWPDQLTFFAHRGLTTRWWTPHYNRTSATPTLMSYVTSHAAEVIDDMTEEEARDVRVPPRLSIPLSPARHTKQCHNRWDCGNWLPCLRCPRQIYDVGLCRSNGYHGYVLNECRVHQGSRKMPWVSYCVPCEDNHNPDANLCVHPTTTCPHYTLH